MPAVGSLCAVYGCGDGDDGGCCCPCQGPYEVGSMLLGLEGVVQIMLTLADSDDVHFQVG